MKKAVGFFTALLAVVLFSVNVYAVDVFFEQVTRVEIAPGVFHERYLQMTTNGLRDVHVLRVPLGDDYIRIAPVTAGEERGVGFRETTLARITEAGAVAGINADFFNLVAGGYTAHLGLVARDGVLLSALPGINRYEDNFAVFFLDFWGNVFFRYTAVDVYLYHNGGRHLRIPYFNNVGHELVRPMVFTRTAMTDTAALNARFPNTVTIVSDGVRIIQISGIAETVEIPEGGFIVVLPYPYTRNLGQYRVGDAVTLSVTNTSGINFENIQAAVGGGGLMLQNGVMVQDTGIVAAGRQPHSAVGVTQDGNTLILMTVDGRGASVGATHSEMTELMRRMGAFNAMYFDGGGSTTMVVQNRVVNTPSEGTQRRIANALGIFDTTPVGPMAGIVMELSQNRAAVGTPVTARVFAEDARGTRFDLTSGALLSFAVLDETTGSWYGNTFTLLTAGLHILHVWYGAYWASHSLYVADIAELHIAPISLMEGQNTVLRFSGTATDGTAVPMVTVSDFTVVPESLGYVRDGHFYAVNGGTGFIRAQTGNAVTYIPVSIGGSSAPLPLLESNLGYFGYPAFVTGGVRFEPVGAHIIPRLEYHVRPDSATQAGHMTLDPPLALTPAVGATPVALRMQVYGDGSGHWMRGRVRDAGGHLHNIDFTRELDFTGWGVVTAQLPANAPGPFVLDRIWMVTLGATEYASHSVFFYNLHILYAPPHGGAVPQGTRFNDRLRVNADFAGTPGGNRLSFSLPLLNEYRNERADNVAIINLAANSAGLTDRRQWEWIRNDVRNAGANHVVLLMDANPRGFSGLMFELFHEMMRLMLAEGRSVFVVYSGGNGAEAEFSLRDGVRYIGLTEQARQIHFWVDGEQIWWWA